MSSTRIPPKRVFNKFSPIQPKLSSSMHEPGFVITAYETAGSVDVWLHGIVGDEYTQTDSLSIGQVLGANRGKPLTLHVNSPGGLAYDGVAIFTAIQMHDATTVGIIEGLAGSAASLAIMACDRIKAHEASSFAPHYSMCLAMGHRADLVDCLNAMEKLDAELEAVYMARSGNDLETVKQHLLGPHGDGTRFSAAEAKAAGYVDDIIPLSKRKPAGNTVAEPVAADRVRYLRAKTLTQRRS